MAKDVIMPVLGMNQDTAVLLAWLKQEGEAVEQGEPIMEVETDKATMELDAPASGTLAGVRANAGDEVKVGSVVAVILGEGEDAADAAAPTPDGPAARADRAQTEAAADTPDRAAAEGSAGTTPGSGIGSAHPGAPETGAASGGTVASATATVAQPTSGIVPASPKARRLAQEHGVGLEGLRGRGRGPDGAVLAADVLAAARRPTAAAPAGAARATPLRFERTLPAEGLLATVAWAGRRLDGAAGTGGVTIGDLIARFLAAVWSRHPLAPDRNEAVFRYRRLEDGRLDDTRLTLPEASSLEAIVRARVHAAAEEPGTEADGAPPPADVVLLDLSAARAELAPDSAIPTAGLVDVLVGRLEERVLAMDGEATVSRSLSLALAFDPARVDLAEAASFCDRVIALVEEPATLALLY